MEGRTEPRDAELPQCRICLDGDEPELGRLIRPCLCKGSISHVHVKCLNIWRDSSSTAFFSCPQCHYRYNYQRTKIMGLATNPVVVGAVTSVLFTAIVFAASFVTTSFMSFFNPEALSDDVDYYYSPYWVNPFTVGIDLIRAALRVLQDQTGGLVDPDSILRARHAPVTHEKPGMLRRFIQRFLLGLPIVGAGSLVQMLFSVGGLLAPVQWLARSRGRNRRNGRNGNTTDMAAMLIVALLIIGALRAIYKVYQLTEAYARRLLVRAEDIILEVN